jgi:hypothetical protein
LTVHVVAGFEVSTEGRDQKDPQLASWTAKLLEDRAARSALIQRLSRQLHHVRQRLMQAARYVDGLLTVAHTATREPWPLKLLCPHCGAPVDQVRADYRPDDPQHHVTVHCHVDGVRCDETKSTGHTTRGNTIEQSNGPGSQDPTR